MQKIKTIYFAISFWIRSGDNFSKCFSEAIKEIESRKENK